MLVRVGEFMGAWMEASVEAWGETLSIQLVSLHIFSAFSVILFYLLRILGVLLTLCMLGPFSHWLQNRSPVRTSDKQL